MYLRNDTRWLVTFEWPYAKTHKNGDGKTEEGQCKSAPGDPCDQGQECADVGKTIHHAPCGTCFGNTAQFCSEDGNKVYRVTYSSNGCSQPLGECDECGKVTEKKDLPQERDRVQQPKDAVCDEIPDSCSAECHNGYGGAKHCFGNWHFEKLWFSVDETESVPWPCQGGLTGLLI